MTVSARGNVRTLLLAGAASLLLAAGAAAQPTERRVFDVPAGDLGRTLTELAQQGRTEILFDASLVRGKRAPAVRGAYTTAEAVAQALAASGLSTRISSTGSLVVEARPQSVAAAADAEPTQISELTVTGTNIRGGNPTSPGVVLDRAAIDATGAATVVRLMETLPQNFTLASQSAIAGPTISSQREQGSAINLRGIGEGTTLVLLNGRRMALGFQGSAADISGLPLSAVERVEVLTDGASAVYGSDAVGGVVNFILRKDYDGAETRLRRGFADSVDEVRMSQALGTAWASGNALVSLEYYSRDKLMARDRSFVPADVQLGSLLPGDKTASVFASARQELTSDLSVHGDVLYTYRKSDNESGLLAISQRFLTRNPQLNAGAGVTWDIGEDWQVSLNGGYGRNTLDVTSFLNQFGQTVLFQHLSYKVRSAQLKADGPLFQLPGGAARAAFGAEWRGEQVEISSRLVSGAFSGTPIDAEQEVSSLFAEMRLPLAQRFEVSLAGRYDKYDRFGSSFDPRVGVFWEPVAGLKLRGSWGTSYVAPRLLDYNVRGANQALALRSVDPGVAGGFSNQLIVLGYVPDLEAQESESWSVGASYTPEALPGLRVDFNYFDIGYKNRITNTPSAAVILANPASYADLFIRNPTLAQVNEYIAIGQLGVLGLRPLIPNFTPSLIEVIVDQRRRNLSRTDTRGFDVSARYEFDLADGRANLGVAATRLIEQSQQVTESTVPFDTLGTIANPTEWRMRAQAGWSRGGVSANAFVNFTDSYVDNRVASRPKVNSWTTVDARVAYAFGPNSGLALSNVTLALSAQNLFDEDPPTIAVVTPTTDFGFDTANASPLGRLVAIELSKTW